VAVLLGDLRERIKDQPVIMKVREGRFEGNVYLVGGAIREIALHGSPKDYDFVIDNETDLGRMETIFSASSFILGKKPIQTRRLVVRDLSVDINVCHEPIEDDLRRRDFTMNAIAYDVEGDRVLDPLGGSRDLAEKVIRYPAKRVLPDDPLRMLKAIRHFATLEGFSLDRELMAAIRELKGLIHEAAPERVKHEMDQIVTSPGAFRGLRMMEETGLIFELFPGLEGLKNLDKEKGFVLETYGHTVDGFKYLRRYADLYGLHDRSIRDVGYALLFHDLGKAFTFSYDKEKEAVHFFYHERRSRDMAASIMESLRFSAAEMKAVLALIENHMRIFLISGSESTERAVRRLVYKMGDLTPALIVLSMCDMYGSSGGTENPSTRQVGEKCGGILRMYYEWKKEPLPRLIKGDDLLGIGFQSGPLVGMVLADIREKQISGEISAREEALRYARTFLPPPAG
jgi:tRNA nucleotidyltransferase/poly(A) polymerase